MTAPSDKARQNADQARCRQRKREGRVPFWLRLEDVIVGFGPGTHDQLTTALDEHLARHKAGVISDTQNIEAKRELLVSAMRMTARRTQ